MIGQFFDAMAATIIDQLAYALATAIVLFLAYRSGSPSLIRAGWVMVGNLSAVWVAVTLTDNNAPWHWFIVIDFMSGILLLPKSSTRIQSYVGAFYFWQIVVSLAFGLALSHTETTLYLYILAFGGVCQLLILATGAVHGRGRKIGYRADSLAGVDVARATHSARVEPGK